MCPPKWGQNKSQCNVKLQCFEKQLHIVCVVSKDNKMTQRNVMNNCTTQVNAHLKMHPAQNMGFKDGQKERKMDDNEIIANYSIVSLTLFFHILHSFFPECDRFLLHLPVLPQTH